MKSHQPARYILILLFLLFPLLALQAKVQTIHSMQAVESYLAPETWVIMDLDHTLFEGATLGYGHGNWFYDQIETGKKLGYTKAEVIKKLYPHWALSQRRTEVKPVEAITLSLIKKWQNAHIPVIGATSRQTSIAHITLDQLQHLDVQFSPILPDDGTLTAFESPTLIKDGVIFCSDFNAKGEVVRAYFTKHHLHPKKIVFIDDSLENLHSMLKAFEKDTEVAALYYPLVAEQKAKVWDSAKANQAYYEVYLDNPVLTPFFLEKPTQLAKQNRLLNQNAHIQSAYEFTRYGQRFVGLPGVFSPQVFGGEGTLQQKIPIRQNSRLLEIGPGTGDFAVSAALKGAQKVLAIDISSKAVENTKQNVLRFKVANKVEVRQGDIFSSLQKEEKFDLIFWDIPFNHCEQVSQSALAHGIFDHNHELLTRFLKEAGDYLTPGGSVYLNYSPTHGNLDYFYALAHHYQWQIEKIEQVGNGADMIVALYAVTKS